MAAIVLGTNGHDILQSGPGSQTLLGKEDTGNTTPVLLERMSLGIA